MELTNFVTNIPYMLKGMLGLFIALGIITLATMALNRISDKNK